MIHPQFFIYYLQQRWFILIQIQQAIHSNSQRMTRILQAKVITSSLVFIGQSYYIKALVTHATKSFCHSQGNNNNICYWAYPNKKLILGTYRKTLGSSQIRLENHLAQKYDSFRIKNKKQKDFLEKKKIICAFEHPPRKYFNALVCLSILSWTLEYPTLISLFLCCKLA